jgi:hypothetical protein
MNSGTNERGSGSTARVAGAADAVVAPASVPASGLSNESSGRRSEGRVAKVIANWRDDLREACNLERSEKEECAGTAGID